MADLGKQLLAVRLPCNAYGAEPYPFIFDFLNPDL